MCRETNHQLTMMSDRSARASQLELMAHRLGYRGLAARIAAAAPDRAWQTDWSHGRPITDHQVLTGHTGEVDAVAIGALWDGTPVIVSGGGYRDCTVRVWRLADGTPVAHPLDLSEPVSGIALHGNIVVTAAGQNIAVRRPVAP